MNRLYFIWMMIILGCTTNMHTQNQSKRYVSSQHSIHHAVKVYHTSSDSSEIHFQLLSGDLLYTRSDQSSPFIANYSIHYDIIDPLTGYVIDSSTATYKDTRTSSKSETIQGSIPIAFSINKFAKLNFTVIDNNRNSAESLEVGLDKKTNFHAQNFMLVQQSQKTILNNVIRSDEAFTIKSDRYNYETIYMKYYSMTETLPPPPFSSTRNSVRVPLPDTILVKQFGGQMQVMLDKRGIYHFTDDTLSGTGFTLLRFSNEFPKVSTNEMLYEPLRYLTSSKEYENIVNAPNQKSAIDNFWIELGGTKDIARKLIKSYYGRVEEANKYFSTYIEGWRTDRGLIYIIFGPPERVIELTGREVWQYGNESVSSALNFTFTYVNNELSDNVYELERSVNYKSHWYRALDTWRSGRIYTAR